VVDPEQGFKVQDRASELSLHHRDVFQEYLLGGWFLTINLVGSVLG